MKSPGRSQLRVKALREFVEAIEATGGVVQVEGGVHAPACDEDWIDLGEAYILACAALPRAPLFA